MNEGFSKTPEKRKLPIGSGGKIEGYEILPAIKVKNEVLWVNHDLDLPFNLEEGKETDLGLFLTSYIGNEKATAVNTMRFHGRSALLGRVILKDKQGRLYRDIDIKGLGFSRFDHFGSRQMKVYPPKRTEDPYKVTGIMDLSSAEIDRTLSEDLLERGLRTHRVVSVIKLKEIVYRGNERMSIEKAREEGIIPKDLDPVIEIRAFGTKSRIIDLDNNGPSAPRDYEKNKKKNISLMKDAQTMVAQELGKDPEKFTRYKYLQWFADTLGRQLAILHNAKLCHGYLTAHNITLDCRIVDLDSVKSLPTEINEKKEATEKDLNDTMESIRLFLKKLGMSRFNDIEEINQEFVSIEGKFLEAYFKNIKE